jgi:hypothetical protein
MEQSQNTGNNCTNLQAKEITVNNNGITYKEAHLIALEVFKANFLDLIGTAKEVAKKRAEEITEKFLTKLQSEYPVGLQAANSPDFQDSLFTLQKEYAKCGDKELGDLLVDLLIDRSKQKNRDILQIVLNESLLTAPKLTQNQIAILSIVFLLRYTVSLGIGNHQNLGEYLDKYIQPLLSFLVKNDASYQHLEYTGCGTIEIGEISLSQIFGTTYQGLFLKGFEKKDVDLTKLQIGITPDFFIYCLNDNSKLQIKTMSSETLEKQFLNKNIPDTIRNYIRQLFNLNKMGETEIKDKIIQIRPYMKDLYDIWENSPIKKLQLTSVGIAIGHANIKRNIGEFSNLSIWIN